MKRNEKDFTFEELMVIYRYLPENCGFRDKVLGVAMKMAIEFHDFVKVCEALPAGSEVEQGIVAAMADTARTFEQSEEAYLYCRKYPELARGALRKMLQLADTPKRVHLVYAYAPVKSDIGDDALRKLNSTQPD